MRDLIQLSKVEWVDLCRTYLPYSSPTSFWRYNLPSLFSEKLPDQGWKIHLSATPLNAGKILKTIAPFLQALKVCFKAPKSLEELMRINAGIFYGYSQIGKFITVYPANEVQFVYLAKRLHCLTKRFKQFPAVPFDFSYGKNSCVFYRFGAFNSEVIRNPINGELTPDNRATGFISPPGIVNPLPKRRINAKNNQSPLQNSYRVFCALTQRGKGGVYEAIDSKHYPPRLCIIKEGRKNGEMNWDGRDAYWRIKNEGRILIDLAKKNIQVSEVYDSFKSGGNFYLVCEAIEGENLQNNLARQKRRLPYARALYYGLQISEILLKLHRAGWVWRDCKPSNLILTPQGTLRPIDFEGAVPIAETDYFCWSSPLFAPPEAFTNSKKQTHLPEDSFALGAILYYLLEGHPPQRIGEVKDSLTFSRRNVPKRIKKFIVDLLDPNPALRPTVEIVNSYLRQHQ